MKKITMQELKQFTGGVKYFAKKKSAYWVADITDTFKRKLKGKEYQIWTTKSEVARKNKNVIITCIANPDELILIAQKIKCANFTLHELELHCVNKIVMINMKNILKSL